ncbi:34-kDa subunit of RNA polymerase III (C) [Rhizophlyctis rosea]|nr:34-kDa subunit of RNA polymerase III (C) [Rhizophlyctis rosea]
MSARKGKRPATDDAGTSSGTQNLTDDERTVFETLKRLNKVVYNTQFASAVKVGQDELTAELPALGMETMINVLTSLQVKQYVEWSTLKDGSVLFKARAMDEVARATSMSHEERVIYTHVKAVGNKGIWIKDIKTKSGLHQKVVTDVIKSLEKKSVIKSVKSVKNPTKKLYILFELEPSVELTGGAWYTDQEMDMDFIDQLSTQIYKYIRANSTPKQNPTSLFSHTSTTYPTLPQIHKWVKSSGITSVDLSTTDVQMLLDRLEFDGKITRVLAPTSSSFASPFNPRRMDIDSDDDDDDEEEAVDMEAQNWMYRVVRGVGVGGGGGGNAWTEIPCGKCPVFQFCTEDGPVNPKGCEYYKKWLQVEF